MRSHRVGLTLISAAPATYSRAGRSECGLAVARERFELGNRNASSLYRFAGIGAWLSIAAIAITAMVSSADARAPFWIMGGFLVCLLVCIAIRVAHLGAGAPS